MPLDSGSIFLPLFLFRFVHLFAFLHVAVFILVRREGSRHFLVLAALFFMAIRLAR